jgi:phenylpropionate dioxygenase-like ring-hydroxylating dioxygenase large terminal subunit|tara:strand:+ start:473 stop:1471 length:999 start_codon:yes stop_codon:yes gene_type:complete
MVDDVSQGRVVVRETADTSVIVTRNNRGDLRGYLNSCSHRGTELVEDDGEIDNVLRCPYHRWTFDLDGTLISTPLFDTESIEDFDPNVFGLQEIRVGAFAGVVWISLNPDVPDLVDWFGDLGDRLAGYGLERYEVRRSVTVNVQADWKLLTENFQEYYHLAWVHPELAKVSKVDDHYRFQGPGRYCGQTTTPISAGDNDEWTTLQNGSGLSSSDAESGRHIALFPNVMLTLLPNHACTFLLEPVEPGKSREHISWSTPYQPSPDDLDKLVDFWVLVNDQDIDICQKAQRGIERGRFNGGRLSPRFEEPLHRFYNMLADRFEGIERCPEGDLD